MKNKLKILLCFVLIVGALSFATSAGAVTGIYLGNHSVDEGDYDFFFNAYLYQIPFLMYEM